MGFPFFEPSTLATRDKLLFFPSFHGRSLVKIIRWENLYSGPVKKFINNFDSDQKAVISNLKAEKIVR